MPPSPNSPGPPSPPPNPQSISHSSTANLLNNLEELRGSLSVRVRQLGLAVERLRVQADHLDRTVHRSSSPATVERNPPIPDTRPPVSSGAGNMPDPAGVDPSLSGSNLGPIERPAGVYTSTSAIATEVSNLSRPITSIEIHRLLDRASASLNNFTTDIPANELDGALSGLRDMRESLRGEISELAAVGETQARLLDRLRARHGGTGSTAPSRVPESVANGALQEGEPRASIGTTPAEAAGRPEDRTATAEGTLNQAESMLRRWLSLVGPSLREEHGQNTSNARESRSSVHSSPEIGEETQHEVQRRLTAMRMERDRSMGARNRRIVGATSSSGMTRTGSGGAGKSKAWPVMDARKGLQPTNIPSTTRANPKIVKSSPPLSNNVPTNTTRPIPNIAQSSYDATLLRSSPVQHEGSSNSSRQQDTIASVQNQISALDLNLEPSDYLTRLTQIIRRDLSRSPQPHTLVARRGRTSSTQSANGVGQPGSSRLPAVVTRNMRRPETLPQLQSSPEGRDRGSPTTARSPDEATEPDEDEDEDETEDDEEGSNDSETETETETISEHLSMVLRAASIGRTGTGSLRDGDSVSVGPQAQTEAGQNTLAGRSRVPPAERRDSRIGEPGWISLAALRAREREVIDSSLTFRGRDVQDRINASSASNRIRDASESFTLPAARQPTGPRTQSVYRHAGPTPILQTTSAASTSAPSRRVPSLAEPFSASGAPSQIRSTAYQVNAQSELDLARTVRLRAYERYHSLRSARLATEPPPNAVLRPADTDQSLDVDPSGETSTSDSGERSQSQQSENDVPLLEFLAYEPLSPGLIDGEGGGVGIEGDAGEMQEELEARRALMNAQMRESRAQQRLNWSRSRLRRENSPTNHSATTLHPSLHNNVRTTVNPDRNTTTLRTTRSAPRQETNVLDRVEEMRRRISEADEQIDLIRAEMIESGLANDIEMRGGSRISDAGSVGAGRPVGARRRASDSGTMTVDRARDIVTEGRAIGLTPQLRRISLAAGSPLGANGVAAIPPTAVTLGPRNESPEDVDTLVRIRQLQTERASAAARIEARRQHLATIRQNLADTRRRVRESAGVHLGESSNTPQHLGDSPEASALHLASVNRPVVSLDRDASIQQLLRDAGQAVAARRELVAAIEADPDYAAAVTPSSPITAESGVGLQFGDNRIVVNTAADDVDQVGQGQSAERDGSRRRAALLRSVERSMAGGPEPLAAAFRNAGERELDTASSGHNFVSSGEEVRSTDYQTPSRDRIETIMELNQPVPVETKGRIGADLWPERTKPARRVRKYVSLLDL